MKIALVQLMATRSVEENLIKTIQSMREAARNGARLVCFPELQFTPFFPQFPKTDASPYTMSMDTQVIKTIQQTTNELALVTIPNLYLQIDEYRYDASPVFNSDGKILGISKMVHVVQAPFFYEQNYYTPSDTGFLVYETTAGRVGVVICFDRHYPESVRTCTLKGAQIIVIPTANTKDEPLEKYEWEVRIAAMQNNVFIAMCNRVGVEHDMRFCGESIVVDPNGDVVAKADDTEQILYADLDFAVIEKSRIQRPYLDLRRPGCYGLD